MGSTTIAVSLEPMARVERFPLFPLGLVLLPGEGVPLHIFEERYKLMVGECLDEEKEFGIVWLSDDGLKEIGCGARITRVLELLEDTAESDEEALERARRRYADLVEEVTESRPEAEALGQLDAYGMAATLE